MTISSLEVGQTLSSDVQIANGRRLFSSGHVVTEQTLRVLKIWGVRDVQLYGVSDTDTMHQSEKENRKILIDNSATAIKALYAFNDTTTFPVSCLLEKSLTLANEKRTSDSFFSYLSAVPHANAPLSYRKDTYEYVGAEEFIYGNDYFPEELHSFANMLNDVYVTSETIVKAIEKNKRVKKSILKICDCLIHVSNCEIKSIYSCTAFFGNRTVLYLAIMLVYLHHVQEHRPSKRVLHYGKYAITTGVAARYIAASVGVYGRECFFSNGILRDIGALFYGRNFTSTYEKVRQKVLRGEVDICTAEEQLIGMNHAEIGGRILKKLGFPASVEKHVQEHHAPLSEITTKEHAVMQVAETVAKALTFNMAYDVPPPAVDNNAWTMLNITEKVLTDLMDVIYQKSDEIIRLAYGE